MLAEDPCVGVDLPRVKRKEMEALSVEECRRFLEVAEKSEWFPLLALALLPLAPDTTSSVVAPRYSKTRMSGNAAAWLNVTVTVFVPPAMLAA